MVYKFFDEENKHYFIISEKLISCMIIELMSFFPQEYGGILVGVRNPTNTIVVDYILPLKSHSTKSKFVRFNNGLNEQLAELYEISNGQIEYLGEWHSHPNGNIKYSKDDENAMFQIADDSNVNFSQPFLLIFSINKKDSDLCIYRVSKNSNSMQLITLKKVG
jgi:integrative and conjugative element protein (TIGR02256 family)